jgi:IS66 C-terminal element
MPSSPIAVPLRITTTGRRAAPPVGAGRPSFHSSGKSNGTSYQLDYKVQNASVMDCPHHNDAFGDPRMMPVMACGVGKSWLDCAPWLQGVPGESLACRACLHCWLWARRCTCSLVQKYHLKIALADVVAQRRLSDRDVGEVPTNRIDSASATDSCLRVRPRRTDRGPPRAWLANVLARIADHPASRLHELLPWHWPRLIEDRSLAA